MKALALALLGLVVGLCGSAFATSYSGSHTFQIVADGVVDSRVSAPAGFFDVFPVGTSVSVSTQYDDSASPILSQCYSSSDPSDCYPVYGGGSFSMTLGADLVDSSSLSSGGPFVVLEDQWMYSPVLGTAIQNEGADLTGLSLFGGWAPIGPDDRWSVGVVNLIITQPPATFTEPVSIVDLDLYAIGDPVLVLLVGDNVTGQYGNVFAAVPEPTTALLVGLGLIGLGVRRRGK